MAGSEAGKAHFHVLKQSCVRGLRERVGDPVGVRDWLGYDDPASWIRPLLTQTASSQVPD